MSRQPFLGIGDPTSASLLLAIGTGALLVLTGVSFVMLLRLFARTDVAIAEQQ